MKLKDMPPIGAEVRLLWEDSGMVNQDGSELTPEDLTPNYDYIRGVVLRKGRKELVVGMKTAKSGPDAVNDMYYMVTIKNVDECDLMIPLAVIAKVLGAEEAEKVRQYTLEQLEGNKKK